MMPNDSNSPEVPSERLPSLQDTPTADSQLKNASHLLSDPSNENQEDEGDVQTQAPTGNESSTTNDLPPISPSEAEKLTPFERQSEENFSHSENMTLTTAVENHNRQSTASLRSNHSTPKSERVIRMKTRSLPAQVRSPSPPTSEGITTARHGRRKQTGQEGVASSRGKNVTSNSNPMEAKKKTIKNEWKGQGKKQKVLPSNADNSKDIDRSPQPRGELPLVLLGENPRGTYECDYCHSDLTRIPRVRCAVCPDFDLCLDCLATSNHVEVCRSRKEFQKMQRKNEIHASKEMIKEDKSTLFQEKNQGSGKKGRGKKMLRNNNNSDKSHVIDHNGDDDSDDSTSEGYFLGTQWIPFFRHQANHGYIVADSARYMLFPPFRGVNVVEIVDDQAKFVGDDGVKEKSSDCLVETTQSVDMAGVSVNIGEEGKVQEIETGISAAATDDNLLGNERRRIEDGNIIEKSKELTVKMSELEVVLEVGGNIGEGGVVQEKLGSKVGVEIGTVVNVHEHTLEKSAAVVDESLLNNERKIVEDDDITEKSSVLAMDVESGSKVGAEIGTVVNVHEHTPEKSAAVVDESLLNNERKIVEDDNTTEKSSSVLAVETKDLVVGSKIGFEIGGGVEVHENNLKMNAAAADINLTDECTRKSILQNNVYPDASDKVVDSQPSNTETSHGMYDPNDASMNDCDRLKQKSVKFNKEHTGMNDMDKDAKSNSNDTLRTNVEITQETEEFSLSVKPTLKEDDLVEIFQSGEEFEVKNQPSAVANAISTKNEFLTTDECKSGSVFVLSNEGKNSIPTQAKLYENKILSQIGQQNGGFISDDAAVISQMREEELRLADDIRNVWTAEEDLRLLDGILTCGLGNWPEIAEHVNGGNGESSTTGIVSPLMGPKTDKMCMERYLDDFLGRYGHILPPYVMVPIEREEDKEDESFENVSDNLTGVSSMNDRKRVRRSISSPEDDNAPGFRKTKFRVVPTNVIENYSALWPHPYIPSNIGVKMGDEVKRDLCYRSEQWFVRQITSAGSKADADTFRREFVEKNAQKVEGYEAKVLPLRVDDIRNFPGAELSGYMPRRGDFDMEWDNDAEQMIADMEFYSEDSKEDQDLKLEVIKIFNNKLDEREKRKQFVKANNLLNYRDNQQKLQELPADERHLIQRMRLFSRFQSYQEHNDFVDKVIKAKRLRKEIAKLQSYRRLGIKSLADAERFELDKSRREFHKIAWLKKEDERKKAEADAVRASKESSINLSGDECDGRTIFSETHLTRIGKQFNEYDSHRKRKRVYEGTECPPEVRASSKDLESLPQAHSIALVDNAVESTEISLIQEKFCLKDQPSFDLLSSKEKELCKNLQLLPQTYLDVKKDLISKSLAAGIWDSSSNNHNAKTLVTIDVTKVDDNIDFVLKAGWISVRPTVEYQE